MILWRISSARLTQNSLRPTLHISVKRKETTMCKKLLEKIKQHPGIIFPIITILLIGLMTAFGSNPSLGTVLIFPTAFCLVVSLILIASWLRNHPVIYLLYILFLTYIALTIARADPLNYGLFTFFAVILFPKVNWTAYKNNTTLTSLFKAAKARQSIPVETYKKYRSLVLYYTSLVIILFLPAYISGRHVYMRLLSNHALNILPEVLETAYLPIYTILCLTTLCAIIALFCIRKTNKQLKTDETPASTPEAKEAPKGAHRWLWLMFYIVMMLVLMPLGFFLFAYIYSPFSPSTIEVSLKTIDAPLNR